MKSVTFSLRTVQLAPRTAIENYFAIDARISQILLAMLTAVYALDDADFIFAPIFLGIVIGLMFLPLARLIQCAGATPWLSGLAIVLLFLVILMVIETALSVPLSNWIDKAPMIWKSLHFIESQFVTTQVLGVTMTMNPFLVFLSLAFWIWLWGPIGGFIAVSSLLVIYALLRNTVGVRNQAGGAA